MRGILMPVLLVVILFLLFIKSADDWSDNSKEEKYIAEIMVLKEENYQLRLQLESQAEQVSYVNHKIVLADEDRDLIERVVSAEIRGGNLGECLNVATVIFYRMTLSQRSAKEVLLADRQFADPHLGTISPMVKKSVALVFDEGLLTFEEPTTHFYQYHLASPSWAIGMVERGRDRFHVFLYEEE